MLDMVASTGSPRSFSGFLRWRPNGRAGAGVKRAQRHWKREPRPGDTDPSRGTAALCRLPGNGSTAARRHSDGPMILLRLSAPISFVDLLHDFCRGNVAQWSPQTLSSSTICRRPADRPSTPRWSVERDRHVGRMLQSALPPSRPVPRMCRWVEWSIVVEGGRTGGRKQQLNRRQDKSAGARRRFGAAKSLSAHRLHWRHRLRAGARFGPSTLFCLSFSGANHRVCGSLRISP